MSTRNQRRADRIDTALDAYFSARADSRDTYDAQTDVTDMLADLMHFCAQGDLDFDRALSTARRHFAVEVDDELDNQESEE